MNHKIGVMKHKTAPTFTYVHALDYMKRAARIATPNVESPEKKGIVMGLDNVRECLDRLQVRYDELRVIHIAGTNGKGSTAAFVSTILANAGYEVGRYSSPAVFEYREIIQRLDPKTRTPENISEEEVAKTVERISRVVQDMVEEGKPHLTPFEIETVMAFITFLEWKCDFAVVETGMGGRDDATNVLKKAECSIITSIGMDHMGFLGNDLAGIASHKAGIIKKRTPLITTSQRPEVMAVLRETCARKESPLSIVDMDKIKIKRMDLTGTLFQYPGIHNQDAEGDALYEIRLLGMRQIENAALAITAISVLRRKGYRIDEEALQNGLRDTVWKGRMEVIGQNPRILVDGAHNPDAAKGLKEDLAFYFKKETKIGIMGIYADKDYKAVLSELQGVFHVVYTIAPDGDRGLQADTLAREVQDGGTTSKAVTTLEEAVRMAKRDAERVGEAVIVIFGSLSIIREAIRFAS